MSKNGEIQSFFDLVAENYDTMAPKYHPRYHEMLEELVNRVTISPESNTILDLGCGTGNLGLLLLTAFPRVTLVCLDNSAEMLRKAELKYAKIGAKVQLVNLNMEDFPAGNYGAVVSSLATHHLREDNLKIAFYKRVFANLATGGSFWNADITGGISSQYYKTDEKEWRLHMEKEKIPAEEIDKIINDSRNHDCPSPLLDQLNWLRSSGLTDIDCTWKYHGYTVFGGCKS